MTGKCHNDESLKLGKELAKEVVKEFEGQLRGVDKSPEIKYPEQPDKQYLNDLEFVLTAKFFGPGLLPHYLKKKDSETQEENKLRVGKFLEGCTLDKYEKIGDAIQSEHADEKGFFSMYQEV